MNPDLSGETEAADVPDVSHDLNIMPTAGQLFVIESDSFTADKFISKRTSKKWDVPPAGVAKKTSTTGKSFDNTVVDPSEFAPKVVPMCEVEGALDRGGEGEGGDMVEVVSMTGEREKAVAEAEAEVGFC